MVNKGRAADPRTDGKVGKSQMSESFIFGLLVFSKSIRVTKNCLKRNYISVSAIHFQKQQKNIFVP